MYCDMESLSIIISIVNRYPQLMYFYVEHVLLDSLLFKHEWT